MSKVYVSQLMIEVTRKCNLQCGHCIRGAEQKKNVDLSYITALLERIDGIGTIMFSGGEPALNAKAIRFAYQEAKRLDIPVEGFYVATNGTAASDSSDFLISLIEWYSYINEKDLAFVKVSEDEYHENERADVAEAIYALNFVEKEKTSYDVLLFNDGFAADNGLPNASKYFELSEYSIEFEDNCISGDEPLYLSANGDIGFGCNFSYDRFDRELAIVNINQFEDEGFDLLESLKSFYYAATGEEELVA